MKIDDEGYLMLKTLNMLNGEKIKIPMSHVTF